jgi:hypothetical protein
VIQQSIDKCSAGLPGHRVHGQPGRLVDDYDVLVFIQHLQGYRLWLRPVRDRVRQVKFYLIPGTKFCRGLDLPAVDKNKALFYELLDVRACREFGFFSQKRVKARRF